MDIITRIETKADAILDRMADTARTLARSMEAFAAVAAKFENSESANPIPSTIILPGMPHLEWMTENLSGFGGTEDDGRWYYTYDEAVKAVRQLGDGWRIPTRGEMVDLAGLGSVWQEDGPHSLPGRLFGGSLFLEAAGIRSASSEALADVGTSGRYWSYSSGVAGNMGFGSYYIYPLFDILSPCRLSVRCVRNIK